MDIGKLSDRASWTARRAVGLEPYGGSGDFLTAQRTPESGLLLSMELVLNCHNRDM